MPPESAPRNPFLDIPEGDTSPSSLRPTPPPRTFEALGATPPGVQSAVNQSRVVATPPLAPLPAPRRSWRPYILRAVAGLVIVGFIGAGSWWGWQWLGRRAQAPSVPSAVKPEVKPLSPEASAVPESEPVQSEATYQSENFRSGEIVIGGEAQFLLVESDVTPLEVSDIRGEAFTEKGKQEVKLVVTWRTNKLSQGTLSYAKGVGQTEKTVAEADYAYDHSLIVGGLDPASTYLYTLAAEDRFGNRVVSEPHAVFTGARSISLFDLIAGAIGDVFGWAVNK